MQPEPRRKPDPLTLFALAHARRRRRRSPVAGIVVFALLLGLLGLIAWWAWPAADPGPLWVTAFDELGSPGQPGMLRAQVAPQKEPAEPVKLNGISLWFVRPDLEAPVQQATDDNGIATTTWQAPDSRNRPMEFVVRLPAAQRRRAMEAFGRAFVWPRESSLLLVDADDTLASQPVSTTDTASIRNAVPVPGAAQALAAVRPPYRIVYVTNRASGAIAYYHLSVWLRQAGPRTDQQMPDGPLVGSAQLEAADPAEFYPRLRADMQRRFSGKLVAVTARPEQAQAFRQAGFEVLRVGTPEGPGSVAWSRLVQQLP